MELHEIFGNYRSLADLNARRKVLWSATQPSSPRYSHTPKSKPDYYNDLYVKFVEVEAEYYTAIITADLWLKTLPINQRTIMQLRYVEGLEWQEVAKRANYSEEHCRRLNSLAKKNMLQNVT